MPSAIFNPVLIHSSVFPSPSGRGIAAHSIRCYLSLRGNFGKLAQWRNLSMAADNPVNLDVCIIDAGKERDRVNNANIQVRSEEHTSELQSPCNLVCRLLLEKKKKKQTIIKIEQSKK